MEIKEYITEYEKGTVYVSPGVEYNLKDVIDDSYRLFNGKFEQPKDSNNLEKIFYNIGWILYRTLFYASNIDTKDMNMRSTNGQGIPLVALFRKAIISHLNRTRFGKFLEDLRSDVCAFGAGLVKIVDGQLRMTDLRNIVRPADITDVQDSGLVEKFYYTWDQMQTLYKGKVSAESWATIELVRAELKKLGRTDFTMYEFWNIFEFTKEDLKISEEDQDFNIKKKKVGSHKGCCVYLDTTVLKPNEIKDAADWNPYVEIDKYITPHKRRRRTALLRKKYGEYEELYPYKQCNLMEVKGRWLPFGVFELIKGLQEHYNEKWYYYRKKDILDLKGIFKHKKGNTGKSIEQKYIDAMETGALIDLEGDEDIERLIIDTKTSQMLMDVDKLFEIARQVIGISPQGTGAEDMPADTPATVAVINKQTQQTTYDYVIEQLSHFLVELFEEFYIDQIIEEMDEEEYVSIVGDPTELKELQEAFVINLTNKAVTNAMKKGLYADEATYNQLKQAIEQGLDKEQGDMRFPQIKKSLLKNIDYYLEFYVNNERFDKNVQIKNLLALLADPNFAGSREKIEMELLDLMGLDGKRYQKSEEEKAADLQKMMLEQGIAPGGAAPGGGAPMSPGMEFSNANPVV
jgi:hypothetical protein